MKDLIKENINNPEYLERLYRENRNSFKSDFEEIYSAIKDYEIARYWKARLEFDIVDDKRKGFSGSEIFKLVVVCLVAGFLIIIPNIFTINLTSYFFYEKNAGIIFFFGLTLYNIWTNKNLSQNRLIMTALAFAVSILYINLLPSVRESASINLAYIHLPLLMWCIYGIVFTDFDFKNKSRRIDFIKHNGDLATLGAIILIAGGALAGITIGLFSAIGINIQMFYLNNIAFIGLVSAPVVTNYIIKNYYTLTNKIAPIVASLFSPLITLTLVVFLVAFAISGKDPYNDRDFLLIFNLMLIGVMGIIVFSISETSMNKKQKFSEIILFTLSFITLIINLIALSAIFYRLSEFGITPNRLAIVGSNILIFCNLVLIMIDLFKVNFKKSELNKVEMTIARYLPVYMFWILFVVFGFPIIFGLK